jgi:hypothetical protein
MTASSLSALPDRDRYSDAARDILHCLEYRLTNVVRAVHNSEVWQTVASPQSPRGIVTAVLREVMWSVLQYQPRTTEAGFRMIGRLPKTEWKLIASLAHHKAEEAEHGGWARRDYLRLGGKPERLELPLSPATFSVAAVWDRLADSEDPVGYLGAEFLFESLTMQLAPRIIPALVAQGIPADQIAFITEHAVEDVKHTNLITHWILDVATRLPANAESMIRAFDYFAAVFPLPVWSEALERARD